MLLLRFGLSSSGLGSEQISATFFKFSAEDDVKVCVRVCVCLLVCLLSRVTSSVLCLSKVYQLRMYAGLDLYTFTIIWNDRLANEVDSIGNYS